MNGLDTLLQHSAPECGRAAALAGCPLCRAWRRSAAGGGVATEHERSGRGGGPARLLHDRWRRRQRRRANRSGGRHSRGHRFGADGRRGAGCDQATDGPSDSLCHQHQRRRRSRGWQRQALERRGRPSSGIRGAAASARRSTPAAGRPAFSRTRTSSPG